jgi:hypothetical protein
VRENRVWARLLDVEQAVIEGVEIDDKEQVVVSVRPRHRERDLRVDRVFFNRQRLHTTLNYATPQEFEDQYQQINQRTSIAA